MVKDARRGSIKIRIHRVNHPPASHRKPAAGLPRDDSTANLFRACGEELVLPVITITCHYKWFLVHGFADKSSANYLVIYPAFMLILAR